MRTAWPRGVWERTCAANGCSVYYLPLEPSEEVADD